MKYYFVVGSRAVWECPNAQDVANAINEYEGDIVCFDAETMTPPQLLDLVDGWHDHREIEMSLYNEINKLLKRPR
jgi:hypothetical protein